MLLEKKETKVCGQQMNMAAQLFWYDTEEFITGYTTQPTREVAQAFLDAIVPLQEYDLTEFRSSGRYTPYVLNGCEIQECFRLENPDPAMNWNHRSIRTGPYTLDIDRMLEFTPQQLVYCIISSSSDQSGSGKPSGNVLPVAASTSASAGTNNL